MQKVHESVMALFVAALVLFAGGPAEAQMPPKRIQWVGSWATAQQLPEPRNSLATEDLQEATLRQIVHLSLGGTRLRVHISNAFGTAPMEFTSVHIARAVSAESPRIQPATDKALMFSGAPSVTVPAGAEYISDALEMPVPPFSDLAITIHLSAPPAQQTGHPGSRATSYLVHGNQVSAEDLFDAKKFDHWYWISGVDVAANSSAVSVVTLGDSITDGHGATTNGNDRWPDFLARRLQASPVTKSVGVLNLGIGGNRLLLDGLGPNALARFDRDVLAQAGVRCVIVLEGVNDLGMLTHAEEVSKELHNELVHGIIGAYEQIIERAHAHGIRVIGATILPYSGSDFYHPDQLNEEDRQTINQWIRTSGRFDAVADFDKVTRDPKQPNRLLPEYDSGDHLHPSPAGFRRMADEIPLRPLAP